MKPVQPAGRGKIRIVGGVWRSRQISVPPLAGLRPTPGRVRQTVFDWLATLWPSQGHSLSGMRVLDAFAGSGAMGFEAASRGAFSVHCVENHPRALASLREAKDWLNASTVRIHAGDALAYMDAAAALGERFDLIILDPPFASSLALGALERAARCLAPEALVYLETDRPWDALRGALACVDYRVLRRARAGAVHYHLLRHQARGSEELG